MLAFVQKNLLWLIFGSLAAGLLLLRVTGGYDFTPAFCALAALVMIYPSLVPLEFDRIKEVGRHKKTILLTIAVNFLVLPALATLIGLLFIPNEPMLRLGLILIAILPGGGMVTTWAHRSKADMPLTIGIVFANLLAAVVLVPFYLSSAIGWLGSPSAPTEESSCLLEPVTRGAMDCFIGGDGNVSPLKIALPILVIIVVPLLLAYATQSHLKNKAGQEAWIATKQRFAAFSNLGLLLMLFILMGVRQNTILFDRPDLIGKAAPPLALFYLISLGLSWVLHRLKGGAEGKALFWGTYLRYITLALGLAVSLMVQNPEFHLAIIMVILSYLIQIPLSFWMAKKLP